MRSPTLVLPVLLATATLVVWAEERPASRTVEVHAEVHGSGRTPEQARHEALQRAREKAVAEVSGVQVSAQQLRLRSEEPERVIDAFSSLIRTSTYGRIVKEHVAYSTTLDGDTPVYRATLKAEVVVEHESRDPGFTLDLTPRPEMQTFRDGETLVVEVTSSRDCYLTVLNVLSDGSVALLFPNAYDEGSRIPAGKTHLVPSEGLTLRVDLREGADRDSEQILAIATLDPIPLRIEGLNRKGTSVRVADYESMLAALNRWLVRIPPRRRAETFWGYEIVR